MKIIFIITSFFVTGLASGQSKADKELSMFLKKQQTDTFLIIKSGCGHCEISYEDSLNAGDTVTIFLLFKKNGQLTVTNFSDTSKIKTLTNIRSEIFKFISAKRQALKQGDAYYRERKLLKFQPPCLAKFPYEKLQIKIGQFRYSHTIVGREMDDCGSTLTSEAWFRIELQILEMLDNIKLHN
jgi:hypothetical protein